MVNPNWLRSFCALVETQNFTRTAEQLFMTQSGVSQHVKKLEAALDSVLLNRDSSRFELTEAGKRLYEEALPIVTALSQLSARVTGDAPYHGRINIVSPGSVGLQLYQRLLAYQQKHPGLVIDHRFAPNVSIESGIADRQADLGVMTQLPTDPRCAFEAVGKEALLLVTPADCDMPSLEALIRLGFIDHPDGQHHANLLLSANIPGYSSYSQLPVRGFSNQIGLILEPVSKGLGFTVLPHHAVMSFNRQTAIKVHRLPVPVFESLYLVTPVSRVHAARVSALMDEIRRWLQA